MGKRRVDPTGIECGPTCTRDYNYNTSVTLAATPRPAGVSRRWGGACSGNARRAR